MIVVHDPRMCHDLDPRSYLQGEGHCAHIPKIGVRAITSLPCWIGIIFYTVVVNDPRMCHNLDLNANRCILLHMAVMSVIKPHTKLTKHDILIKMRV